MKTAWNKLVKQRNNNEPKTNQRKTDEELTINGIRRQAEKENRKNLVD